jgi:4,5-dihydroxyphthalate decarboxylase
MRLAGMVSSKIRLSVIPSFLTAPVLDGRVAIKAFESENHPAPSVDANSVAMLNSEFDVGEMSLATFIRARSDGLPLVGLPLFTGRRFIQQAFVFPPGSSATDPSQLKGKRIGLPQFWMTSSVWGRFVLHRMYGLSVRDVSWTTFRAERMATLGFPEGVEVSYETSRTPVEMLASGELDAAIGATGRQVPGAAIEPGQPVPAFTDLGAAQRAYYEKVPVFPIMHMIVMDERLAHKEPHVAHSLCDAFTEAKAIGLGGTAADSPERAVVGGSGSETARLLGSDPWPYGIKANRFVLESLLEDVLDQGLINYPLSVDDLFVTGLPDAYD